MDANLDSLHVFGFNLKILNKIMQKKLPGNIAQKVTPCIISLTVVKNTLLAKSLEQLLRFLMFFKEVYRILLTMAKNTVKPYIVKYFYNSKYLFSM